MVTVSPSSDPSTSTLITRSPPLPPSHTHTSSSPLQHPTSPSCARALQHTHAHTYIPQGKYLVLRDDELIMQDHVQLSPSSFFTFKPVLNCHCIESMLTFSAPCLLSPDLDSPALNPVDPQTHTHACMNILLLQSVRQKNIGHTRGVRFFSLSSRSFTEAVDDAKHLALSLASRYKTGRVLRIPRMESFCVLARLLCCNRLQASLLALLLDIMILGP